MNRAEMMERLKAGYAPIDIAIEKWKQLEEKWNSRDAANDDYSCALCETHTGIACENCPLKQVNEQCCMRNSAWLNARKNTDAKIMLTALYKAKAWLEDQKCKEGKIEPKEKEETYSIGDRLFVDEDEYIIGRCGTCTIVLINIKSGNYWDDPTIVEDDCAITKEEINNIHSMKENTWRIEKHEE